jgi:hypothetical protein
MQSIKAALAAGLVVASSVGGAYAAGVVGSPGDDADGHTTQSQAAAAGQAAAGQAAPGQAAPAVAPPRHAASARPADDVTTSAAPSESATAEPTETADPTDTATTEPTATATPTAGPTTAPCPHRGWRRGEHHGWAKKGKHHGVGHGTGSPARPDHTKAPKPAHAAQEHGPHRDAKH